MQKVNKGKEAKAPAIRTAPFGVGAKVQWNWMGHKVRGSVKRIYFRPIVRVFRETTFRRNGSVDKPAYLVKSDAGSEVLKSHTELSSSKPK